MTRPIAWTLTTCATALLLLGGGRARAADPTTADCLAASDESLKLGNQHKLRAERSQLLVCAASSCPTDIRKECLRRVEEVNAQLPTLVFSARDAAGGDTSAVKVTMDGEALSERLEGTALSVDPGPHAFTFELSGQPPVTRKLLIVEGQKDRRELVTFGAAVEPGGAAPPPGEPEAPGPGPGEGTGTQKVLAIAAIGVGVAGLGLGSVFGLMAMSAKNDARGVCPAQCATQDGVNKWSDASSKGNVATIAFITGGLGLAAGAVLWLTAPGRGERAATQVGFGPGGVQLRGAW